MNLNFKTLCSAAVLCFAGDVFAMDSNPLKDGPSNNEGFSQLRPVGEVTSSESVNLVDLFKEMAMLRQQITDLRRENTSLQEQNSSLQQQIKPHESVLAEALDQTIHTKDEKVLEKEYDQLVEAVKSVDEEKLRSLIDQGIDVDETVNGKHHTVLEKAIRGGRMDRVALLLNNGADPKKSPKSLKYAMRTGKADLVELLIENGADPNALDGAGNSILLLALKEGYSDVAKLFLSIPNNDQSLELLYSGKYQSPMSKDSLNFFVHYDTPNDEGISPLMQAISSDSINDTDRFVIVKSLLEKKADVNRIEPRFGRSVLKLAKQRKIDEKITKLLEEAGALNYYNLDDLNDGKTPVARLYKYCQDSNGNNLSLSDLKFDFEIKSRGKFVCIVKIKNDVYRQDKEYGSKEEAKNAIADYALRKLIEKD